MSEYLYIESFLLEAMIYVKHTDRYNIQTEGHEIP